MELDAIAAVAVGGTPFTGGRATVSGTLLGALIIQLVRYTLLANGVPDGVALVVKARDHRRRGLPRRGQRERHERAAGKPTRRSIALRLSPVSRRVLIALAAADPVRRAALRPLPRRRSTCSSVLRYNSMFALIALGMCFVIMTGGIDLSVGSTAALRSVVSAMLSPYGLLPGLLGGARRPASRSGIVNGFMVARLQILPFIATLAGMLAASGTALLLAHNQSVSVSYDTGFTWLGQGDFLGFPDPGLDRRAGLCLRLDRAQLHQLRPPRARDRRQRGSVAADGPAGRSRDASRPTCSRACFAGLAGVILAAQFGAGPAGRGRRLGIVLDRRGRRRRHLADRRRRLGRRPRWPACMLLGLIFNVLNFENGMGWISLSAYWQSVVRGVFLMVVVMAGPGTARRVVRLGQTKNWLNAPPASKRVTVTTSRGAPRSHPSRSPRICG